MTTGQDAAWIPKTPRGRDENRRQTGATPFIPPAILRNPTSTADDDTRYDHLLLGIAILFVAAAIAAAYLLPAVPTGLEFAGSAGFDFLGP